MGKDKRYKYTPLSEGDVVDLSVAITQASVLLDNAARKVLREGDVKGMVSVANSWIEIGKMFSVESEDEVVDISDEQYGFCMPDVEVDNGSGDKSIGETVNDVESR